LGAVDRRDARAGRAGRRVRFRSLWLGDHVSFPVAILDPLLQLAQAAVVSRRLTFGTGVYLLPLPAPRSGGEAGQHARSPDRRPLHLRCRRRRRVPKEYQLCGVPLKERGGRLTEGIEILRKLWSGRRR